LRKSDLFLLYLAINFVVLSLLVAHASLEVIQAGPLLREKRELVKGLGLSDLCLFTEASYTRHLTQADLNTPFQDSPLSLEHFPSGSIVLPPAILKRSNAKGD